MGAALLSAERLLQLLLQLLGQLNVPLGFLGSRGLSMTLWASRTSSGPRAASLGPTMLPTGASLGRHHSQQQWPGRQDSWSGRLSPAQSIPQRANRQDKLTCISSVSTIRSTRETCSIARKCLASRTSESRCHRVGISLPNSRSSCVASS